jgi:hypothetical protein
MPYVPRGGAQRAPVRIRSAYHFTLSKAAIATLSTLSQRLNMSQSRTLETFLLADYAAIFTRFKRGEKFADIVIATGFPPMLIRELYREYQSGFDSLEAENLDKRIEIERVKLQAAEVKAAAKERIELIRKSGRIIEAEAIVRAERVRTRKAGMSA